MSSAKTTTVVKGVIWSFAEKVSAQLVSFGLRRLSENSVTG